MPFIQYDQLAPNTGYGYRFDSTVPHQRYYFVSRVGYGVQSHVQLVQDRETGLKVVQKVDRQLCPSSLEHEEPAEISILRRLISSHRVAGYQPRWITLLNYEDVLAYQETEAAGAHLSYQVSYWKFCNGGTLYGLLHPYIIQEEALLYGPRSIQIGTETVASSQAPFTVLRKLPISLVARAIRHICETLEVMYQGGSEPVYHCDLHASNIFLHWTQEDPLPEFYIGDFGMARTGSQSLLDSQKFEPRAGIPFNQQPEGIKPPGVGPEGCRRRWDFVMHQCGNLTNYLKLMVGIAAKDASSAGGGGSVRLPVPRPQAPQRSTGRDLVKQIAREKSLPAPRHGNGHKANSSRPCTGPSHKSREFNVNNPNHNMSGPDGATKANHLAGQLFTLFKSLETLNEQDQLTAVLQPALRPPSLARIIEVARHLENESLKYEQHSHTFKEFVAPKKQKALFQEFGTKPFVFRKDGPEAKEILRNALKRPPPKDVWGFPFRDGVGWVTWNGEVPSLQEVWGRENVAGPWRVVEVRG